MIMGRELSDLGVYDVVESLGSLRREFRKEAAVTKEDLSALIREVGLGGVEDRLMQAALPSLRLVLRPTDEDALPVGASKFGGAPDLPPGFEWPVWQGRPESEKWKWRDPAEWSRNDGPLCFLAQFRLADLAAYDLGGALPPSGLLYFFCAIWKQALGAYPEDRDCWKVMLYEGDASGLARRPPPVLPQEVYRDAQPPENNRFTCCRMDFQPEMTLPDNNDPEPYEALALSEEESELYAQLFERLDKPYEWGQPRYGEPIHRLLGCPQIVQYGKEVPDKDREWRLLLQLDTDDAAQLNWQGGGRGYFWIPAQALAEQDFDAAWVDMQAS